MKTWIKRISIGIAVVVVVAVAALAIFVLTFDPNEYKARLVEMVQQRYHRTLNIDGDIEMSLFPRLGVKLAGVSLSEPDSQEPFASIESVRAAVAVWPLLSRQLVVDRVGISGLKAHVVRKRDGRFNFSDLLQPRAAQPGAPAADGAGKGGGGAPMHVDIAGLELRDGELQIQDEVTGDTLGMTALQANTGRVRYGQPFDLSLSGHVQGSKPRIDATVSGQAQMLLDPPVGRYAARNLDVRIDIAQPGRPDNTLQVPISGSLAADAGADTVEGQLSTSVEGGKYDVSLKGTQASTRQPSYEFAVSVDTLDVDKLMARLSSMRAAAASAGPAPAPAPEAAPAAAAAPTPAPATAPAPAPAPAAAPLPPGEPDLRFLVGPAATGTVKIGHLVAHGFKADNLSAGIGLNNGLLGLSRISANLYGGSAQGSAWLEPGQGNALRVQMALANVAVAALFQDIGKKLPVSGTGNVDGNISARGLAAPALLGTLSGTVKASLRDGAIEGADIPKALRDLKAAIDGKGNPADLADLRTGRTPFSSMQADLQFANGVGTITRLNVAAAPLVITQGSPATIDVARGQLDLVANVNITSGDASDYGDLRNVTVPVQIKGPYEKLAYGVDWKAIAGDVLKRGLQQRLLDAIGGKKGGSGDSGGGGLGNLLKGLRGK